MDAEEDNGPWRDPLQVGKVNRAGYTSILMLIVSYMAGRGGEADDANARKQVTIRGLTVVPWHRPRRMNDQEPSQGSDGRTPSGKVAYQRLLSVTPRPANPALVWSGRTMMLATHRDAQFICARVQPESP